MADEGEIEVETGELELTPEMAAAADEQDVIMIGEEEIASEEAKAPDWVKDLRRQQREDARRIRELEAELTKAKPAQPEEQLGPRPKLEDFDFDSDAHDKAVDEWIEKRDRIQAQEIARKQQEEKAQQAWQVKLNRYEQGKRALRVPDFDEAEAVVGAALNDTQKGIILQGADRAELLFYALGKNGQHLNRLAGITDPVEFAWAAAKMETQLKTTTRKPGTAPEKRLTGTGGSPIAAADDPLDELREKAAKGDQAAMQKIMEIKRQRRAA